jgi:hypothetical protein
MRKFYLPAGDLDKLEWLGNFNGKIGAYATLLGISVSEVTDIASYHKMLQYILGLIDTIRSYSQDVTKYKNLLIVAPLGTVIGDPPPLPTLLPTPATTAAGIFTIISGIVKRIKGSGNYTEAIGEDLRVIGADIFDDNSTKKPALKLTLDVENPKVKYKKNRTQGINLYRDLGNGDGFKLLIRVNKAEFVDSVPFPVGVNSLVVKYKGVYVVDDMEVGIPSDEATITVKKSV